MHGGMIKVLCTNFYSLFFLTQNVVQSLSICSLNYDGTVHVDDKTVTPLCEVENSVCFPQHPKLNNTTQTPFSNSLLFIKSFLLI